MNEHFAEFESELHAQGFETVVAVSWPPNATLEPHQHPHAARARVVTGEMWLTSGGRTTHLLPGGSFELAAGEVHSESYGPEGATYWVGRRTAAST
jgi:quercetin dioxygenase-like cupin family protein